MDLDIFFLGYDKWMIITYLLIEREIVALGNIAIDLSNPIHYVITKFKIFQCLNGSSQILVVFVVSGVVVIIPDTHSVFPLQKYYQPSARPMINSLPFYIMGN